MNLAKSDVRAAGLTFRIDKITHDEPNLKDVITSRTEHQDDMTSTMSYNTDGHESTNYPRGAEFKSKARWVGDELIIENRSREWGHMTDRWSLSADGHTLTIARHMSSAGFRSADLKIVFDKQTPSEATDLNQVRTANKPPAENRLQSTRDPLPDAVQTAAEGIARRVTVELKTGEHIEGIFKQATLAGTALEVGGQLIMIPADKIQGMSFGAAAARPATGPAPFHEALDELNGLRSVTESGITYLEYSRRVLDARVKVDQYLASAADGPLRSAIMLAMREYELASHVWSETINPKPPYVHETLLKLIDDKMLAADSNCPSFVQWHGLVSRNFERNWYSRSFAVDGLIRQYPATVWACASDHVAGAQRLSSAVQQ
jgi:hypothetical protein